MFATLIAAILSLAPDLGAAEGLRRTAPAYLSPEASIEHIAAARAGVAAAGLPPRFVPVVLAIAHHESRFEVGKVQREPRCFDGACWKARFGCGVMTPVPRWHACPVGRSLAEEYEEGARHLLEWLGICGGNELCALRGYSGNQDDRQTGNAGRKTWQVFAARAAWIQAEMSRGAARVRPSS